MDRLNFLYGRAALEIDDGELHLRMTTGDMSCRINLSQAFRTRSDPKATASKVIEGIHDFIAGTPNRNHFPQVDEPLECFIPVPVETGWGRRDRRTTPGFVMAWNTRQRAEEEAKDWEGRGVPHEVRRFVEAPTEPPRAPGDPREWM